MDAAVTAWVVGVAEGGVSLTATLLGGGFGRCPQLDDIAQAVCVTMYCGGRLVQLIGSRKRDTTHDFYLPMHAA